MNFLLINPNSFQPKGENRIQYYPMNYAYLSAYLKEHGHRVEMIDALWHDYSPRKVLDRISRLGDPYDYIGLGGQINYYSFIKEFARLYKERNGRSLLLLGGPMTFGLEKELMTLIPEIDFIALGEALDAVLDLFRLGPDNKTPENLGAIPGLVFKENGKTTSTGYPPEKDINTLPLPDLTLGDYRDYLRQSYLHGGRLSAHVIAGRGCPFKCTYCSAHFNGLRLRSVDHVMNEISLLKDRYDVDDIVFLDETFTYKRSWVEAFCRQMKDMGLTWLARTRVDLVDKPLLEMMKEAGCRTINYGIESGSETILRAMNKKVSIRRIEETIDLTRAAKLPFTTNFMIGMPEETIETLKETLAFLIRNDLRCGFAFTYPLPGTKLFEDLGIQDLDTYLSQIKGYFYERLIINLTELSDKELLMQKESIEYTASYHYFTKRFNLFARLFHRIFYKWQVLAKENPYMVAPLGMIKRMVFRQIEHT
jgi:radical SAM superfamily enzyme YgiQ (UPF0313 family)